MIFNPWIHIEDSRGRRQWEVREEFWRGCGNAENRIVFLIGKDGDAFLYT